MSKIFITLIWSFKRLAIMVFRFWIAIIVFWSESLNSSLFHLDFLKLIINMFFAFPFSCNKVGAFYTPTNILTTKWVHPWSVDVHITIIYFKKMSVIFNNYEIYFLSMNCSFNSWAPSEWSLSNQYSLHSVAISASGMFDSSDSIEKYR